MYIYLRKFINTSHMLADALKYYLSSKPLTSVSKMYCEDTINVCLIGAQNHHIILPFDKIMLTSHLDLIFCKALVNCVLHLYLPSFNGFCIFMLY